MRFVLLHKNNESAERIAVNPLVIKRVSEGQDAEGNEYTIIYYNSDKYPNYDEVTEDFETVLDKIELSLIQ